MNPENPTSLPPSPTPEPPVSPVQQQAPPPGLPPLPGAEDQYQQPKKSKKKLVLIILGIGIVIFVAIFFLISGVTDEQAKISDQFIADLQSNNVDDAYSLTATEFQQTTPKDKFKDFVAQENQFLPKNNPSVVSREISSTSGTNTTTIVSNIKGDNGSAGYHATTQLVKENGKWLILSIDIKAGPATSTNTSSSSSSNNSFNQ
ncbi:MAG TPA: hypothetical protein VLF41_03025 [Candidatus Nanoarchaeia archaeon]|nr:hypothetical protein [Candidatus Nanoarchaeia archaeon]